MTGVNFAAGKAFVISSTTAFEYIYDLATLKPAGRIKIGQNLFIQTATTDTADQKIYLASATDHSVYIIDGRTNGIERVANVGLYPWGTHIMDSKDNYCH
jgi:YVTN family beta-propeller protein